MPKTKTKKRTSIYLDAESKRRLKALARLERISASEWIRRRIDKEKVKP